ncbi:hypothetical protein HPB48_017876 [Haemaphysalis longicornis]|uniref:Uncharacterized protein n=1 Tax=Haemaphysalis longicornis TaxID=44386 RepID=A0A9J6GEE3_HAELO|nr:hypothetical protein HPB48_017876 [Haemaphysalis longicornis]
MTRRDLDELARGSSTAARTAEERGTYSTAEDIQDEELPPFFAEVIPNVTVPRGRDAKIPCVIDNLGSYRVRCVSSTSLLLGTGAPALMICGVENTSVKMR